MVAVMPNLKFCILWQVSLAHLMITANCNNEIVQCEDV